MIYEGVKICTIIATVIIATAGVPDASAEGCARAIRGLDGGVILEEDFGK